MEFKDFSYKRIDINAFQQTFDVLLQRMNQAKDYAELSTIIMEIEKLRQHFSSAQTIVEIRNSINTADEFYEAEQEYYDEISPVVEGFNQRFYQALLETPYRSLLEEKYGNHLFKMIEVSLKTYRENIIPLLVEENKLSTKYDKLIASAQIPFMNGIYNLSEMTPFCQDVDRKVRKAAQEAISKFFLGNKEELETIYDDLVKNRHQQAISLGFKNYVELGYYKLGRTDYDASMVDSYRQQIYEDLLPISLKVIELQKKRLGLENLKYYDLPLNFLSGNPNPKGSSEDLILMAQKMYGQMSKETKEFFNFMTDSKLMDLVAKKNKRGGGYCTYIYDYQAPFIFSNFNGTKGDVDVLTHEAGHAFQVYCSRGALISEYFWPTLEACEIHSMSMEFFAYPWMNLFFKEEALKYEISHLSEALTFVPYGALVDEFQHFVYENPLISKEERNQKWREIEKKYLPYKDYEDNVLLEQGCYWFKQGHIFRNPFYYIDYTLAQVCALSFYLKSISNYKSAWKDYLRLCEAGGKDSFLNLLLVGNIDNPFEKGTVKRIADGVFAELEKKTLDFDSIIK